MLLHVAGQGRAPALVAVPQVGLHQLVLGGEGLVQPLQGHSGRGADLVHAHGLDAAGVEQFLGGVEQPYPGFFLVHKALLLSPRTIVL